MTDYFLKDEYEADRLGLKYMDLAGYDLYGMVQTLELLRKESKGNKTPAIISTHPHLDDRIEQVFGEISRIRNQAENGFLY